MRLKPQRWWFFPPLMLGVLVMAIAVIIAPGADHETKPDRAIPVRVMSVSAVPIQPKLRGFGEVKPRQSWQGVAQVAGKVVWRHPDLRAGATFAPGTRLIEIEPLDYQVAESKADAQLSTALAGQAEVHSRGEDLFKAIEIEIRGLVIAKTEYRRNRSEEHTSELQSP